MNDRIIVKRNFDIIGYNERAINSNNFREAVDYVVNTIKSELRYKSINYMLDNINGFYDNPNMESNDSKDLLRFEIKCKDRLIALRVWDATIYPAKVRYTINIRENIFDIIYKIQRTLSTSNKNLSTQYLTYSL